MNSSFARMEASGSPADVRSYGPDHGDGGLGFLAPFGPALENDPGDQPEHWFVVEEMSTPQGGQRGQERCVVMRQAYGIDTKVYLVAGADSLASQGAVAAVQIEDLATTAGVDGQRCPDGFTRGGGVRPLSLSRR